MRSRALMAGAVAVAVLGGVLTLPSTISAQTETGTTPAPAWTAVLDAAVEEGAEGVVGYSRWSGLGSLSPLRFVAPSGGNQVMLLLETAGGLYLVMRRSLENDFVLDVNGTEFRGSQSLVWPRESGSRSFWWPLSQSAIGASGGSVDVSLTFDGSDSLAGRAKVAPGAWFSEVPAAHDGSAEISLQLNFDENDLAVTAQLLTDALDVTGASLVSVASANRTPQHWAIKLQPDSDGSVTVALDATADCASANAICASDGRMLRNRAETVVPGPASDIAELVLSDTEVNFDEGTDGTFDVSLNAQPTDAVTVSLVLSDTKGVVTLSDQSLAFTTSDWDDTQTVTVSSPDDDDAAEASAVVELTAASNDSAYDGQRASIAVKVADGDTAGLRTTTSSISLTEDFFFGSGIRTGVVYVYLTSEPTATVTVNAVSDDEGAAIVSPASFDLTASNYSGFNRFQIDAIDDDDANNETVRVTFTLSSDDLQYHGQFSEVVTVSVHDDETARLVLSRTTLDVDEGGDESFTVQLDSKPDADVTVSVTSGDTGKATLDTSTLTFTPTNWSTAQSVAVTGVADDDVDDEPVTVSLAASSTDTGYNGATASVSVTVEDDDVVGLVLSDTTLDVTEGSTATFTVALGAAPSETTTVAIESSDTAAATVLPDEISFTSQDWGTAVTVTVTGADDDDLADAKATITAEVTTGDATFVGKSATVAVDVSDDDTAPRVTSDVSFDLDENSAFSQTLTAIDDDGDAVTGWSIAGGADQALFSITPAGVLTMTSGGVSFLADYEDPADASSPPDNVYEVTVEVTSGTGGRAQSTTAAITVTVEDVLNDDTAPRVTGTLSFSLDENSAFSQTLTAIDDDGDAVTGWSIAGGADQALFSITPAGVLTMTSGGVSFLADYEDPGDASTPPDNVYEVTVEVTSGTGGREKSTRAAVTVSVVNVTELPGIPTGLAVTQENTNSLGLTWNAPSTAGAMPLTGYTIEYTIGSSTRTANIAADATAHALAGAGLVADRSVRLRIRALNADGAGDWSGAVTARTDDCAAAPTGACSISTDGPRNRRINIHDTTSDADWHAIQMVANSDYLIEVLGSSSSIGTLDDPAVALHGPDGLAIAGAADDNSGTGNDASLMFEATVTGTHYIVVTSSGGDDTGTYRLRATIENSAPKIDAVPDLTVAEFGRWGAYLSAYDDDAGDVVKSYEIAPNVTGGGADFASFTVDATGRLSLKPGALVDYEDDSTLEVIVTITSGDRNHDDRDKTAAFSVSLAVTDVECADDTTTGCELTAGTPQIEDIGTAADADWLEISLTAGTGYRIEVAGADANPAGGTLADPIAALLDSNGDAVTFAGTAVSDDDSDGDGVARFTFTPGSGDGGVYYVAVSEDGDDGTGTYTVTVSELADSPPRITNSSTDVAVDENTSFSLQITAVDDDPGHAITGYSIYPDGDGTDFSLTDVGDSNPGVLSLRFAPDFENPSDSDSDNEYRVGVIVASGTSGGTLSTTQWFTVTVNDVDEPPETPTNVRVTSIGLDSLGFAWDPPSNAGRPGPVTYSWRHRAVGDTAWTEATATAPSGSASSLDAATEHEVQVRATNPEGDSDWSGTFRAWTQDCAASTSTTCSVSENASITGRISTRIGAAEDADWIAATLTAGVQYRIDVAGDVAGDQGGTLPDPRMWMRNPDGNRIAGQADENGGTGVNARLTFTPATTGVHYIEVASEIFGQDGTYTVSLQVINRPPSITNSILRHELAEHTSLSLIVTAADGDSADSVTGFAVSGGADAALFEIDSSGALTMSSSGSPYDADFERPGDIAGGGAAAGDNEYQVEITVTSGDATQGRARSAPAVFTIVVTDVDEQPDKAVLRIGGVTLDTAAVAWDRPATAGPDITGYTVSYEANGSTNEATAAFDALSHLLAGLDPDTDYRFRLRAHSDELDSEWSDELTVVTDDCGDGDDTARACAVAVDGSARGRIDPVTTGDRDWYSVTLRAGVEYRFAAAGGSQPDVADPSIALFNSDGSAATVAGSTVADSDGVDPADSDDTAAVIFTPPAAGTYYIEVSENGHDATGDYELTVETVNVPPAFDNGDSDAVSVPEFASLSHTVAAGDEDTGDNTAFSIAASTSGGGADYLSFEIDSGTGELSFAAGVETDHEAKSSYTVIVTVTSGTADRARSATQTITVTVADADCAGGISTVCELVPDRAEIETLASGADVDWLEIDVEHGKQYRISASGAGASPAGGTLADPAVTLYDSNGTVVAAGSPAQDVADADADADGVAEVTFVPPADGTYYLAVSSSGGSGSGTYTVSVAAQTALVPPTPVNLRATRSELGALTFAWDMPPEEVQQSLSYSLQYRTDPQGTWQPATADPDRTATVTGLAADSSYEVQVRATNVAGDSAWTDSLEAWTDDCAAAVSSSCTLTAGTAATGRISSTGPDHDADWFSTDLVLGTTYQIDVKGSEPTDTGGTLDDPAVSIYDESGTELPHWNDTDSGAGDNARLMFTANGTGTFYVEVTENGGDALGTYTVTIAETATALHLTGITSTSVRLGWTRPATIDGFRPFIVERRKASETTWTRLQTVPYPVEDLDIEGLASGTTYEFRVGPAGKDPIGTLRFTVPECAQGTGTVCSVTTTAPLAASLEHASDIDWIKMTLAQDTPYRIDAERSPGPGGLDDIFVRLYNSDGTPVSPAVSDGDDNTANDARLEYTPDVGGDYFVAVSHPAGTGTGRYSVSLTDRTPATVSEVGTDFPADTTTDGFVLIGERARGNVESAGDVDWFGVSLEPGTVYSIYQSGLAGDSRELSDPRIVGIYTADGTLVPGTGDDDSGSGNDALVVFEHQDSSATGYFVAVAAGGSATGKYELWVAVQQPGRDVSESETSGGELPPHAGTSGHLVIDGEVTGRIDIAPEIDVDAFGVVLEADRLYAIEVRGECASEPAFDGGTLVDPMLTLRSADGTRSLHRVWHLNPADSQASSQFDGTSSGACNNKRIEVAPRASGIHYVGVTAASGTPRGYYDYTVVVFEIDGPVDLESGGEFTCARWGLGDVTCWGDNSNARATPPSGVQFAQIDAGSGAVCGVAVDGALDCWGRDDSANTVAPSGSHYIEVGVGDHHSCAVRLDGTVDCWGLASDDRLQPPQGTTFSSLAAGRDITCGVEHDGSLACWGRAVSGNATPPSSGSYAAVAAGDTHACALAADGSVSCWGDDTDGKATPPAGTFISIDASGDFTCGIDADFAVTCWGTDGSEGSVSGAPTGGTWFDVSAGDGHACALSSDLTVECWGANSELQAEPPLALVDDDCADDASTQCTVSPGGTAQHSLDARDDVDWVGVTVEPGIDYKVYVGPLGARQPQAHDPQIEGIYGPDSAKQPDSADDDSGSVHDAFVVFESDESATATFYVAVAHSSGSIGSYRVHVSELRPGSDVSEPASGDLAPHAGTTGFVTVGGTATGNIESRTGDPDVDLFGVALVAGRSYRIDVRGECTTDADEHGGTLADVTAELVRADGSRDFAGIAKHLNAVDGQPASKFRDDDSGSCNNAMLEISASATGIHYLSVSSDSASQTGTYTVAVTATTFREPAAVSAGDGYSCAVLNTGEVECWGASANGRTAPPSGVDFAQLGLGRDAACGTSEFGDVSCWGDDSDGIVGSAPGSGDFVWAEAGAQHACALRADGTVECWGNSANSRTEPPTDAQDDPVEFDVISVGNSYNCGIATDGSLHCWGSDTAGNTTPPSTGSYVAVTTGQRHACAIKANGSVECWGDPGGSRTQAPSGSFSAIDSSRNFTCGVQADGSIACWGVDGADGRVSGAPTTGSYIAIAVGWDHACALTTGREVKCWGSGADNRTTPPDTVHALNVAPQITSDAALSIGEYRQLSHRVVAFDQNAGDELSYSVTGGADQASFAIGRTSGVLTQSAGVVFDYLTQQSYTVEVTATGGSGDRALSVTQTITITVTDRSTLPPRPELPQLVSNRGSSVVLSWTLPAFSGPDVTTVTVWWREAGGTWLVQNTITAAATNPLSGEVEVTGLQGLTDYELRLAATNAIGPSGWSGELSVTTATTVNVAPQFTSSARVSVTEHRNLSHTVVATDENYQDSVTYSITGGADQAKFEIDSTTGEMGAAAGVEFDHEQQESYTVVVTATSGTGSRAQQVSQTITVRVIDVDERAPTPVVSSQPDSLGSDSVSLRWTVGLAGYKGPDFTGVCVAWRVAGETSWDASQQSCGPPDPNDPADSGVVGVTGLAPDTEYEFVVGLQNGELPSSWSSIVSVTTEPATN